MPGQRILQLVEPAEACEAIMDKFEHRFQGNPEFHILLLPVEAALPRLPEEEGTDKTPPEDAINEESVKKHRVSREELYSEINEGLNIGISWSSLKWLAAALSVGIGFGLQEIVANFISGLIILFERPIRVGDLVTVANVDGAVTKIRIRATTMTNWDRKEYIVPNKEFITGNLMNWTLSNPINRVVITMGVAYGSDTQKARELILKVAREHPIVLEDPAPLATFEGFGDNAFNLVLRCYLPNFDNWAINKTELHMAIDKAFREAGITIAFPQRDIHLGTDRPLQVNITSKKQETSRIGDTQPA